MQKSSDRARDVFVAFVAAVIVASSIFVNLTMDGGRDWDVFESDLTAARRSIIENGELPFWMPYRAGGHDAFGDPQSCWLSPIGLLTLIFNVKLGIRIFIILSAFAGALGMARIGARLGLGWTGRGFAAALWTLAPPLALYTAGGVPTFILGFALLPWIVYLSLQIDRQKDRENPNVAAVGCGALLALDLYGGDVNHFVFHSLFISVIAVGRALAARDIKILANLILIVVSAVALAAPKLVPMIQLSARFPRPTAGATGDMRFVSFGHALLDRGATAAMAEPRGNFFFVNKEGEFVNFTKEPTAAADPAMLESAVDWVNCGAYVGFGTLAFFAIGIAILLFRRRALDLETKRGEWFAIGAAGILFTWLTFGVFATPSLWNLLHELPVFSTLRSPGRLMLYVVFVIAIFSAIGVEWLFLEFTKKIKLGAAVMLFAVAAMLIFDVHKPACEAYAAAFIEKPEALESRGRFVQINATWPQNTTFYGPRVLPGVRANLGIVNGYGAIPIASAVVSDLYGRPPEPDDLRGQYLPNQANFSIGRGWTRDYTVTSRSIYVQIDAAVPSTITINQNAADGWRVAEPAGVVYHSTPDGLISIDAPAGMSKVLLKYTPPGLWLGLSIFSVYVVGTAGLFVITRRKRGDS